MSLDSLRRWFAKNPTLAGAMEVARKVDAGPLPKCKVAFLRSFTVEPVVPLFRALALVHGVDVQVKVGAFNAYAQEILDSSSWLREFAPDVVFLALQTRDLLPQLWDGEAQAIDEAAASLKGWIARLAPATVIAFNFDVPATPSAGLLDAQSAGQAAAIRALNDRLRETGAIVLDLEGLAARVGRSRFYDEKRFLTTRLPFAADHLIDVADACLRSLLAATGKVRKALVVDLDNTLWGGIVGEDGVDGLKLGREYPGAAFLAVQRALLDLQKRGVLLAIASKNNPPDAREALEKHPGMLLRPEHFAAVRIGWNPKAQSLREIALELNIGVDSLAFLDDNPVEREHVSSELPEVYVLDLPDDPMQYAAAIRAAPVFERVRLTDEDRARGQQYAEQRQRAELQEGAGSVEEFLRSLAMTFTAAQVSPATLPRIAQLTQKTNQFNLTTRRYTEAQVAAFAQDPAARVYGFSLRDRFGDNGLVGVAIARGREEWTIDTFLMSCRVIGRTFETAMLAHLAAEARAAGATALRGEFIRSAKNDVARDLYRSNGFALVEERPDGASWTLDLAQAGPQIPAWFAR